MKFTAYQFYYCISTIARWALGPYVVQLNSFSHYGGILLALADDVQRRSDLIYGRHIRIFAYPNGIPYEITPPIETLHPES